MLISTLVNLTVAFVVCVGLFHLQRVHASFSVRVFTGLGLGVVVGTVLHLIYGIGSPVITSINAYLNIVGSGYAKLLQMIVMPLIIVLIVGAIVKLKDTSAK